MALIYADGFDQYSTIANLGDNYTEIGSSYNIFYPTGGKFGEGGLWVYSQTQKVTLGLPPLDASASPLHVAFWAKLEASFNTLFSAYYLFLFKGNNNQIGLRNDYGSFFFNRYGASTALGYLAASPSPFPEDLWVHCEAAIYLNDVTGYVKFWIDGELIFDYSGDTIGATVYPISFLSLYSPISGSGSGNGTFFDDLIVWDEIGSEFTHTQLGRHRISTLKPSGAGTHTDYTPNSGANYAAVDESGFHDGDTSYNESSTVNDIDTFACDNMPFTPDEIFGVQVNVRARDLGAPTAIKPVCRSGTTDSLGAETPTHPAVSSHISFFANDPNTASAWTPSAVDAMEIGYKHSA